MGIYYHLSYVDGRWVCCKDWKPIHFVEITKAGRGMRLKGGNRYTWHLTYLFPEASDKNINPSFLLLVLNAVKENSSSILTVFKSYVGNEKAS